MVTITHLSKNETIFFVPLGIGAHLEKWSVSKKQIHELEWWQDQMVGKIRILCTPNRHYSGRGLTDYKATLWSSWTVIGPKHSFYYSGDTGYSKHFKEIGERFGPFDMSFIKIGAYGPGDSWLDIHMDPQHAVQAHIDVQANGAKTSRDHANSMKEYKPGYDAHMESADKAQSKANLSLVAAIGALAYGYFTGVFSDDD
jgi:L-ascorbate metabolism protein UlaG (beta-lactamase superfamily)